MHTKIEILEPILRCATEGEAFYQRLSEVAGMMRVTKRSATIYLTVASALSVPALQQVIAICEMWHTRYKIITDQ